MLIWGWGKTTRKVIGQVFQKTCTYCNTTEIWQLCLVRTWFTLFFIPVLPYKIRYCISCPNCGSYMELTKEQFLQMKLDLRTPLVGATEGSDHSMEDKLKYAGKTETQINYLKQMEELNNN